MRDPIVEDQEFEPFDALLDEVVRGTVADVGVAAEPRSSRLLAAALILLGIGVVVGVVMTRGGGGERAASGQAASQEPQGGEPATVKELVPKDLQQWQSLLPKVQQITARRQIVRTAANGATSFVPCKDEVVQVRVAADVAAWRQSLWDAVRQGDPVVIHREDFSPGADVQSVALELVLDDGRMLRAVGQVFPGMISFHCAGVLPSYLGKPLLDGSPLSKLLQDVHRQAKENGRVARGEPKLTTVKDAPGVGQAPAKTVEPRDLQEWQVLLPKLRRIDARRWDTRWIVRGEAAPDDGAKGFASISTPEEVDAWRAALRLAIEPGSSPKPRPSSTDPWQGPGGSTATQSLRLEFGFEDGSTAVAYALLDAPKPLLLFVPAGCYVEVQEPLRTMLSMAWRDALADRQDPGSKEPPGSSVPQGGEPSEPAGARSPTTGKEFEAMLAKQQREWLARMKGGAALSLEDLRKLPSGITALACLCLTAEQVRGELSRFKELERLRFMPPPPYTPSSGEREGTEPTTVTDRVADFMAREKAVLPHGDIVAAIASLPTLRALSLPGGRLDADDMRTLAKLPNLEELELTLADLRPLLGCLKDFGARLHTLRLHVRLGIPGTLGPKHPARKQAEDAAEAAFFNFCGQTHELSGLRCLDLSGWDYFGPGAGVGLNTVTVERLLLDGSPVTSHLLGQLQSMRWMRELSLAGTGLGDGELATLALFSFLQRLDLSGTLVSKDGLQALRAALPGCEVVAGTQPRQFYDDGQDGKALRWIETRK